MNESREKTMEQVGGKLVAYADGSLLVKRVLDREEGSELAADVWATASRVIASDLAYPEARAALAAAHAMGRIDAEGLRQAVDRLEQRHAELELVPIDGELAGLAGDLAERHALAGSDALHLAVALSVDVPRVVVASWNASLAAAARADGLAIVPDLPVAVAA